MYEPTLLFLDQCQVPLVKLAVSMLLSAEMDSAQEACDVEDVEAEADHDRNVALLRQVAARLELISSFPVRPDVI